MKIYEVSERAGKTPTYVASCLSCWVNETSKES